MGGGVDDIRNRKRAAYKLVEAALKTGEIKHPNIKIPVAPSTSGMPPEVKDWIADRVATYGTRGEVVECLIEAMDQGSVGGAQAQACLDAYDNLGRGADDIRKTAELSESFTGLYGGSPLVLDLDHDGVETTSMTVGVFSD